MARMLAAGLPWREWWVCPLTLADLAMAEQQILWEENSVVRVSRSRRKLASAYPVIEAMVTEDAKRMPGLLGVSRSRVMHWLLATISGLSLSIWRSLRLDGPEGVRIGRSKAEALAYGLPATERTDLVDRIVMASGLDLLSSLDEIQKVTKELPGRASRVKAREAQRAKMLGEQRFPSRHVVVSLAESYGWTSEDVGRLTWFQVRAYLAGTETRQKTAVEPPTPAGRRMSTVRKALGGIV